MCAVSKPARKPAPKRSPVTPVGMVLYQSKRNPVNQNLRSGLSPICSHCLCLSPVTIIKHESVISGIGTSGAGKRGEIGCLHVPEGIATSRPFAVCLNFKTKIQ